MHELIKDHRSIWHLAVLPLAFVLVSCGGGGEFTQEEVDAIVEEAVSEALAAQTTTTTTVPTTSTTVHDLAEAICATPNLMGSCTGDESHVSLQLRGTGPIGRLTTVLIEDYGFPSSIDARIGNTRELDGTLEAETDGFKATWSYHDFDGLSIVIERIP